jgi:hypothetical protein
LEHDSQNLKTGPPIGPGTPSWRARLTIIVSRGHGWPRRGRGRCETLQSVTGSVASRMENVEYTSMPAAIKGVAANSSRRWPASAMSSVPGHTPGTVVPRPDPYAGSPSIFTRCPIRSHGGLTSAAAGLRPEHPPVLLGSLHSCLHAIVSVKRGA